MTMLVSQFPENTYGLIWYPSHRFMLAFHNKDDVAFFKGPFDNVKALAEGPGFGLASRNRLRDVYLAKHINAPEAAFITNYLALTA